MPRPLWEGHLKLSLVSCPVALYSALSRTGDIHFHLLHKKTHNRIRMVTMDPDLGEVPRSDLVRGFEVSKNQYVVVTPEEIAEVRLPSTREIDIEEFVDADSIDRLYWNDPYFLVPSGKTGIEAYIVIRDAMEKQNKVALGRLVLHTRERIVALEPRGKGILLTTLRSHDEVKDEKEFFDDISSKKVDKKMLDIAQTIVEQQSGDFDPSDFKDRYEDALRELIARKQKGQKPVTAAPPAEEENVIDLMEALRRSVAKKGSGAEKAQRVMTHHKKAAKKKRASGGRR